MSAAIVGASPGGDSPPDPTASGRRHFETLAMVCLAGPAASRRCRQGSAPGWRRYRTGDEVLAHHEAAHGVCGHLLGRYVWELTIIEDRTVKVQKTSFSAGHAWSGDTPEPPSERPRRERAETDFRRAAEASRILSIIEPPFGWRSTLRIVRRMRAQANALVDANWRSIMALAEELLRQRELDQEQIARFLKDETRGSYWRTRSQEGGGT